MRFLSATLGGFERLSGAADKVYLVEWFERTGGRGFAGEGSSFQEGRSLPLLVTVRNAGRQ